MRFTIGCSCICNKPETLQDAQLEDAKGLELAAVKLRLSELEAALAAKTVADSAKDTKGWAPGKAEKADSSIDISAQQLIDKGEQALELEDWKNAICKYSAAILIDPDNAVPYARRSEAWFNLGMFREAKEDAEESVLHRSIAMASP
jgi:hypothetical protein